MLQAAMREKLKINDFSRTIRTLDSHQGPLHLELENQRTRAECCSLTWSLQGAMQWQEWELVDDVLITAESDKILGPQLY